MPRINPAARRLISAIAATKDGRVSARVLRVAGGSGEALLDEGFLVPYGSSTVTADDDELDDALATLMAHPELGHVGHLGVTAWHADTDASVRQNYSLDLLAVARRALSRIDCSLARSPVPYLNGAVLDFGTARLPGRDARVGLWVARGLSSSRRFGEFRDLASKRPAGALRVVVVVGSTDLVQLPHLTAHELIALEDLVDHEDGLAVDADILAARLRQGPRNQEPVWVSGDGGVLIVRGIQHTSQA